MKIASFAVVAFATLIGTPALAADMALKAPPPPAPIFSWTGFYVGAHGGADWFHKDWFVPATPLDLASGCSIVGCNFSAGSHNASSWLAGVQAGFNYQINWAVVGVEAQASWTNLHGSNLDVPSVILVDNSKTDNLGTIAGRFGVAVNQSLLYVKGGGAWAHDKFSVTAAPGSAICGGGLCQSVTDTRWGWMAGLGWEYAFTNNWSAKLEYDHLGFGRKRETVQGVFASSGPFDYDILQTVDLVKAGINYRFSLR